MDVTESDKTIYHLLKDEMSTTMSAMKNCNNDYSKINNDIDDCDYNRSNNKQSVHVVSASADYTTDNAIYTTNSSAADDIMRNETTTTTTTCYGSSGLLLLHEFDSKQKQSNTKNNDNCTYKTEFNRINNNITSHNIELTGIDVGEGQDDENMVILSEHSVPMHNYTSTSSGDGIVHDRNNYSNIIILIVELLVALCFVLIWRLEPSMALVKLLKRPIPYQQLIINNNNDNNNNNDDDSSTTYEYIINLNNNETFEHETVSSNTYLLVAGIIPLLVQCCLACIYGPVIDIHNTICMYCISMGITGFVTNCIKNYVGYLRPIFYQICHPTNDYLDCSRDNTNIRKTFISGHSSLSFCGLTLFCLYVHNRFGSNSIKKTIPLIGNNNNNNNNKIIIIINSVSHCIDSNGYICTRQQTHSLHSSFPKTTIPTNMFPYHHHHHRIMISFVLALLLPIGLATFIASSRIYDNKHFPADVIGGSLFGCSVSIFVHNLYGSNY